MPRQKKTEPKQTTTEPEPLQTESKQTPTEPEQQKTESKQTTAEPEQQKTESKQTKVKPLAGVELLHKVKELETFSKEDKARGCGYYSVNKNGSERINMNQFLNALIDAEGIELDPKKNGDGHGGRSPSYRVAVQSNGNLLIGSAYTKQLHVSPGDEFELILGRKHLRLKQVEAPEEDATETALAS